MTTKPKRGLFKSYISAIQSFLNRSNIHIHKSKGIISMQQYAAIECGGCWGNIICEECYDIILKINEGKLNRCPTCRRTENFNYQDNYTLNPTAEKINHLKKIAHAVSDNDLEPNNNLNRVNPFNSETNAEKQIYLLIKQATNPWKKQNEEEISCIKSWELLYSIKSLLK